MRREQFIETRRERWERLESFLKSGGRGSLRRLDGTEVLELGRLYRATTSDLAVAQRDFPGDSVNVYLNGLLARAHPLVYQHRPSTLSGLGCFLRFGFPATYRAALPYIALAIGIFAVSALVSAVLVAYRPALADTLVPGTAQDLRHIMQHHQLWMKANTTDHALASNYIMLNNIKVAFLAFAGGVLVGTGTVLVLVENGIFFGATAAMVAQAGLTRGFWSFVVPHGVIELSVIFMASGAGLLIGDAILRPGLQPRRDALSSEGRLAIQLVFGCVPLLVIAGTIEGYFSPSDAPVWSKLCVGAVSGLLLYSYLLLSRPGTSEPTTMAGAETIQQRASEPGDLQGAGSLAETG